MIQSSGMKDAEKTKRIRTASTKVRDPANDADLELPSHREAQTHARRQHIASQFVTTTQNAASSSSTHTTGSAPSRTCTSADVAVDSDNAIEVVEGPSSSPSLELTEPSQSEHATMQSDGGNASSPSIPIHKPSRKRKAVILSDDDTQASDKDLSHPKKQKQKQGVSCLQDL